MDEVLLVGQVLRLDLVLLVEPVRQVQTEQTQVMVVVEQEVHPATVLLVG